MKEKEEKKNLSVLVEPWGQEIQYPRGKNLMRVLNQAGINFKYSCGGDGSCGRCKVEVTGTSGSCYQEIMACKVTLIGDARVKVPPEMVVLE